MSVSGGETRSEPSELKEILSEDLQAMIVNEPDVEEEEDDLLKAPEDRQADVARDDNEKGSIKMLKTLSGELSELIPINSWKKLAAKLGYQQEEIDYFEGMTMTIGGRKAAAVMRGVTTSSTENTDDSESAAIKESIKQMLLYWCDNEDANIDNLIYTLEGLHMNPAVEFLKQSCQTTVEGEVTA